MGCDFKVELTYFLYRHHCVVPPNRTRWSIAKGYSCVIPENALNFDPSGSQCIDPSVEVQPRNAILAPARWANDKAPDFRPVTALQRIDANVGVSSFGRRLRRRRRVLRADAAREEENQTESGQSNPTKHPSSINRKQSACDHSRKLNKNRDLRVETLLHA